jgi:hypothetical protein
LENKMREITLEQFHAECKAQGGNGPEDIVLICPMCRVPQSARDLIDAGAGPDFAAVEKYLGFSCYGRFTGAGAPRNPIDGHPCNWTLGGFFHLHKLEVVTPDGKHHPRFEAASPEMAAAYRLARKVVA